MNATRKAYEVLWEWKRWAEHNDDGGSDEDSHELYEALTVALPLVKANIKCDRCGRKAVELSDTGMSYCKRCWKAVTDGKTSIESRTRGSQCQECINRRVKHSYLL